MLFVRYLNRDIAGEIFILLKAGGSHGNSTGPDSLQPVDAQVGLKAADNLDIRAENVRDDASILAFGQAPDLAWRRIGVRFVGSRAIEGDAEPERHAGACKRQRGQCPDLHGNASVCAT